VSLKFGSSATTFQWRLAGRLNLIYVLDHPVAVFVVTLIILRIAARFGSYLLSRRGPMEDKEYDDLAVILAAALTLLGLIIGFTFSMAVTRYDKR
jgi:hypothetical protein